MSFKIVADSSSNLLKLEGVDYKSVPLKILLGDKEFVDDEGLNLADFVEEMSTSKEKCSTSCPNVYDWCESFSGDKDCFAVTITSGLSGCNTSAVRAMEDFSETNPEKKVCVIDSLSTGPEMELIIEKLVEYNDAGLSFEDAKAKIYEYMKTTNLLVSLESLTNLAKNGRVSFAVAKIAGVLGIRVLGIATPDGVLKAIHKCRGEKKVLEVMKEEMLAHGFKGGKLRIAHCQNENGAEAFKKMVLADFPDCDVKVRPCRGLCSFYAEKGGIIIGYEA